LIHFYKRLEISRTNLLSQYDETLFKEIQEKQILLIIRNK